MREKQTPVPTRNARSRRREPQHSVVESQSGEAEKGMGHDAETRLLAVVLKIDFASDSGPKWTGWYLSAVVLAFSLLSVLTALFCCVLASSCPPVLCVSCSSHHSSTMSSSVQVQSQASSSPSSSSPNPAVSDFDIVRCSRCQRSMSLEKNEATPGVVRFGMNSYYCSRCASMVGFKP